MTTTKTSANCESRYCSTHRLTTDLIMRYKIHLPSGDDEDPDGGGDDTVGECPGCKMSIQLDCDGYAWVGLGVSTPDGGMIGSVAVIGMPGISEPRAYRLGGKDLSLIKGMGEGIVEGASIDFVEGRTVMDFTISFEDWGQNPPTLGAPTTLIWAHGKDGTADMGYHGPDRRSSHVIEDLMIPRSDDGEEEEGGAATETTTTTSEEGVRSTRSAWIAHGIAAFAAWGVLAPVAIATAVARDGLLFASVVERFERYKVSRVALAYFAPPPGGGGGGAGWLRVHVGSNAASCATTVVAFALAASNVSREGSGHFDNGHSRMGLAMLVLCLHQALGGILRPSKEASSPDDDDDDDDAPTVARGGTDENKVGEGAGERGIDNEEGGCVDGGRRRTLPMKSATRQAWELLHKSLGLSLFFFGTWQMHEGMALYHERYDGSSYVAVAGVYLAWMSMWIVVIVGGIVYRWHLSRNGGAAVDDVGNERRIEHETEMPDVSDEGDEHVFL